MAKRIKKEIDAHDFESIVKKVKDDFEKHSEQVNIDIGDDLKELQCRVCGFEYDEESAPWQRLDGEWFPSYEICVCCNVQFGYEDIDEGSVKHFREKWILNGGEFHYKALMPNAWSREEQMINISKRWRD